MAIRLSSLLKSLIRLYLTLLQEPWVVVTKLLMIMLVALTTPSQLCKGLFTCDIRLPYSNNNLKKLVISLVNTFTGINV